PAALKGTELQDLLLFTVEVGLLAVGVGLSLRANSVNLAVGPIAYAAALFFADRSDKGLLVTAGFTLLIALGAGAVIAVLVAGFGIVLALDQRDVTPTENGLALTGLALGAALLGGTSAFGRRGGIVGTLLAVTLMVLLVRYSNAEKWNVSLLAVAAFSVGGGLVVTRLVETFGRPRPVIEEPEESLDIIENTGGWTTGSRTGGWTSQLPARTTDEGWGAEERWSTR